ncbi:MAG: hypothetical protein SGI89_15265, partial [bacterium]|nr:hypothetical protein [bacterium]
MKKLIQALSNNLKYLPFLGIILISTNLFSQPKVLEAIRWDKSIKRNHSEDKMNSVYSTNSLNIIINVPGNQPTIQAAINAANNGDVITIDAGVYRENITLNKYLQIRGANYGVDPNTGIRGPETIIQPATTEPDPYSPNAVTFFYITPAGSGSTIDGITFDGDNPTLTSSVNINGANIDAAEALGAYDGLSNTVVRNNIIKNINYAGIDFDNYFSNGASTYDNLITQNKFDNIIPTQFGIGVLLYDNCYGSVTNNVMTRTRVGVQTGNFYSPDLGANHSISTNEIESYRAGIFHNLAYGTASSFDIQNNIFTTVSGAPNNFGLYIASIGSAVGVNMNNNNVTGARNGVNFWNCTSTNTVTVMGGILTGCNIGVVAENYNTGFLNANSPGVAAMTGVTINNCDTAIWVRDNILNTNNATIALNINNATNIVNGTGIGLIIEGAGASVSFNGAVPIDFNTNLSKYIRLITNGSDAPSAYINAQSAEFGGLNGSSMTDAELFAVEDKIDHKIDWSGVGIVSVKANNDYVTLNSFYPPNTTAPLIQRGIDAASGGYTVNISSGTFNENVSLNKSVTMLGRGPASTILSPSVSCTGDGINITSPNASVKDLKVSNYNFGLRTSSTNTNLYNVESVSNCQFALATSNGTNGLNIVKCKFNNNIVGGLRAGTGDLVSNVMIDSSEVKGNGVGANNGFGIFVAAQTPAANTFDNITIKNSDFSNNLKKGMYFEKLRNALIDNVIIDNSGTDPAYGFNNGIDINLKYDSYSNIIIQNSSITNCGVTGTASNIDNPSSLAIKARDDAPSYIADPATLTGFTLKNCFVSGPNNGLRFGEFDKVNNSPTGNTVTENNFGNSYSNKAVVNKTSNSISISCNWYGTTTASAVVNLHKGALTFLPYLVNGTDNDPASGFQPVPGSCTGAGPVVNLTQSTSYITIQSAINAANPNDVIEASPGTFNEGVIINKSLTLQGVDEVNCKVDGTGLTGIG